MRTYIFLFCSLIFGVNSAFAYSNQDYLRDLNLNAKIIMAGGDCYSNLNSATMQNLLDYQVDGSNNNGAQLFIEAMDKISVTTIPAGLAYVSHLMTFTILNNYYYMTPTTYNQTYCPDNLNYRKTISGNLIIEFDLYSLL